MQSKIAKAGGNYEKAEELREQLAQDKKKFQAELEEKKKSIRQSKTRG